MSKARKPYSFEEAKQIIEDDGEHIVYDVIHQGSHGDLMGAKEYKESVESGAFIDYDGFGEALSEDGKNLDSTRPSAASQLPEGCAYVLWFNR